MKLSSIAIKYILLDIAVFDYIPFPIITGCFNCDHGIVQTARQLSIIAHTEGYIIQQFIIMFTAIFRVKFESKIKLI